MKTLPITAICLVLLPLAVSASYGQMKLQISWPFIFLASSVIALPGAVIVGLLEWLLATRQPSRWLGMVSALGVVYCSLRVIGLVGADGERGFFLIPIPPLLELVLITFMRLPYLRLMLGLLIPVATILFFTVALSWLEASLTVKPSADMWLVLLGGAVTTTLVWYSGFILGRRAYRSKQFQA